MPESSAERSRKMKEVWRKARAAESRTSRSRSGGRATRRRRPVKKIGLVEAGTELAGAAAGISEALNGNPLGGILIFGGSMVLSKGIKWAAKHSVLHELGVKVGRHKEVVLA